ncbi:MAG: SDR family oxidoreductase [Candidatus Stahlbacteria bacterium]|nr:SDR family oxidoreductase [Candidatus Stahlbacteria bacterium]
MKIVITGGAGFIGSHLCESLLSHNHNVICIDNFITGVKENIAPLLDNPGFKLIEQDVSKYIAIEGNIDWVLHFASPASPIDYQKYPIQTLKVGSLGTHNALGLAKAKGSCFLLASTSEVYGDPLCNPQPESYWGNVNPIGPRSVYDEAKRFAEAITFAYHRVHKIDTRIARIFNTYGERMRIDDGRVVPNFIAQALKDEPLTIYGNGKQTRSFCYIRDLIDGIWKLMNTNIKEPVNLGNPNEFTIIEFAELILKLTGTKSKIDYYPLPVDDPKIRQPDITRARQKLNWTPKIQLEQGIIPTIQYFKSKVKP